MGETVGVDSEVGTLRTVVVHRPGMELGRLTPRNADQLLFDGIPWVGRAQEEHDAFCEALRAHGVEVLYLAELLQETLELESARRDAIGTAIADPRLGDHLREAVSAFLSEADPGTLTNVLIAGLAREELPAGSGLTYRLMDRLDFVIDPLPNLVFTRDPSVWVKDRVAVASLAMSARRRETSLAQLVYTHHPRFRGVRRVYEPELERLEGGDVLLFGPGVVAVGVGERTTAAGVERLARRVLSSGLADVVLAVPIVQQRATMHLDTICTMVDVDAVLLYEPVAEALLAYSLTWDGDDIRIGEPEPLMRAAAKAMGLDSLRVIDTGLHPVTAEREQWDDGNNTLAIRPGLAVAYERNVATNARLEAARIEIIAVPGSELGTGRGGPRCMSCPVWRDPV